LFNRELTIYGSYMGSRGELLQAVELLKAGKLRPVVDSTFPLSRGADAQERMEEGGHFGKIVLTV
jgi:NADPH:quinone reductase-like Zn-dependent oxidoreductase